jgi:hypothetical protein
MATLFSRSNILHSWWVWHFYEMPQILFEVWKNYITFISEYFSIYRLFWTLFAPWRKYIRPYPKLFSISGYIEVFIFNIYSRAMGAGIRIILIVLGLIIQVIVLIIGILIIAMWLFLPAIFILLILYAFLLQS